MRRTRAIIPAAFVGIVEGVSSGRRGGLNPTWVEWLMGFPLGWTDLRSLGNAVVPQIPEIIGRAIMAQNQSLTLGTG